MFVRCFRVCRPLCLSVVSLSCYSCDVIFQFFVLCRLTQYILHKDNRICEYLILNE